MCITSWAQIWVRNSHWILICAFCSLKGIYREPLNYFGTSLCIFLSPIVLSTTNEVSTGSSFSHLLVRVWKLAVFWLTDAARHYRYSATQLWAEDELVASAQGNLQRNVQRHTAWRLPSASAVTTKNRALVFKARLFFMSVKIRWRRHLLQCSLSLRFGVCRCRELLFVSLRLPSLQRQPPGHGCILSGNQYELHLLLPGQ